MDETDDQSVNVFNAIMDDEDDPDSHRESVELDTDASRPMPLQDASGQEGEAGTRKRKREDSQSQERERVPKQARSASTAATPSASSSGNDLDGSQEAPAASGTAVSSSPAVTPASSEPSKPSSPQLESVPELADPAAAPSASASELEKKQREREGDGGKRMRIRYFIIKSLDHEDVEISKARGLWATQKRNEAKLNRAYDSCDKVILIFSVNESRNFQGYAHMVSRIEKSTMKWMKQDGTASWGTVFHVKWEKIWNLSFDQVKNLLNPLNDNMPIKRSRDGQELSEDCGRTMCDMIDKGWEQAQKGSGASTSGLVGGGSSAAIASSASADGGGEHSGAGKPESKVASTAPTVTGGRKGRRKRKKAMVATAVATNGGVASFRPMVMERDRGRPDARDRDRERDLRERDLREREERDRRDWREREQRERERGRREPDLGRDRERDRDRWDPRDAYRPDPQPYRDIRERERQRDPRDRDPRQFYEVPPRGRAPQAFSVLSHAPSPSYPPYAFATLGQSPGRIPPSGPMFAMPPVGILRPMATGAGPGYAPVRYPAPLNYGYGGRRSGSLSPHRDRNRRDRKP